MTVGVATSPARAGPGIGTIMATFPAYRTYLQPGARVSTFDRRTIERAVARPASGTRRSIDSVFDFVREHPPHGASGGAASRGDRAPRGLRRQVSADDGAGAGEGAGGHDVLPLRPPRLAERGRRRPVALRRDAGQIPRPKSPAIAAMARRLPRHGHSRHKARRGRADSNQRPLGNTTRLGRSSGTLVEVERPFHAGYGPRSSARRSRGVSLLSVPPRLLALRHGAGRRDAGVRRAGSGVHGQGRPRGQGENKLD